MDDNRIESGEALLTYVTRLNRLVEKMNSVLLPPLYYMSNISKQLKASYRFEDAEQVERQADALTNYLVDVGDTVKLIADSSVEFVEEEQAQIKKLREMVTAHKAP